MNTFVCPHCGGEVPEGMRFCPHCMTVLAEPQAIEIGAKGRKKNSLVFIIVLCACIVTGAAVYFAARGHNDISVQKNNTDTEVSADVSEVSETESFTSDVDSWVDIMTESIPDNIVTDESSSAESHDETESSADSSVNEHITEQGITPESLYADIKDWCGTHPPKYFGVESAEDISAEQDGDTTMFAFADKGGARIFIGTDKDKNASLIIRLNNISADGNNEHGEEILSALGEILFDTDLSGRDGNFTENGYAFEIVCTDYPDMFYTEYLIIAEKL